MSNREFDIIVYGASGFTGRLVAEYLQAEYADSGLKWAMAGRNAEKLQIVAGEMKIDGSVAILTADSDDPDSLAALAKRSKAIITTVGPYQLYGESLLKACVEAGTDYVDLCGEPAWMKDMIDRYDVAAKKSGARIVLSCGFDSIPFDLGVYHLQDHAAKTHGGVCSRVRCRVRSMKGTFSGGTAASFMETMKRAQTQPEILDWLKDPFSLSPQSGAPQPPIHKPMEEADLGSWATPFIMASINTKNIHRSNALMNYKYGKEFQYGEMVLTGPGEQGEKLAKGMAKSNAFGDNPPKPGEGPSKEERENGSYDVMFIGEAPNGTRIITSVKGDKDPGYGSTSKMIAEAALTLVQDVKGAGGVMTPAPAMAEALIDRLQSHAGLVFAIEAGA
jgi:short subunit dehydrogenase-like uncharacterized protein